MLHDYRAYYSLIFGVFFSFLIASPSALARDGGKLIPRLEDPLHGSARILDGDSLVLMSEEKGRQNIRLKGIDACELRQNAYSQGSVWPCGIIAKGWMMTVTQNEELTCFPEGRDRYHRVLATCYVNERDIGALAIAAGMAIHAYTKDELYTRLQAQAKAAKRGMWAYSFDPPSIWRRQNPSPR